MDQNFQTNIKFSTEQMLVIIEDVSYTNSAFGVNECGDSVFFNSRLVKKWLLMLVMKLSPNASQITRTKGLK